MGRSFTGLALLMAGLPPAAMAADTPATVSVDATPMVPKPAAEVIDVALQARGTLVGQVTAPTGVPRAATAVSIRQGDQVVAQATTDNKGIFYVTGLRGGVYQVASTGASQNFRAWAPRTAPPNAKPGVQLVQRQPLTRGQGPVLNFLTRPLVLGGLVATAIAVPVAVYDHNSRSGVVQDTE